MSHLLLESVMWFLVIQRPMKDNGIAVGCQSMLRSTKLLFTIYISYYGDHKYSMIVTHCFGRDYLYYIFQDLNLQLCFLFQFLTLVSKKLMSQKKRAIDSGRIKLVCSANSGWLIMNYKHTVDDSAKIPPNFISLCSLFSSLQLLNRDNQI